MTDSFAMRDIGRHGLIYGLGAVMGKAVSFIMLPIYTRYLTTADYGILHLIIMTLEVASIASGSRLAAGIFHFYHKAETSEAKRFVMSSALLLLIVTYGVAAVGLYAIAPQISEFVFGDRAFTPLVRIGTASLAFESLILVPLAYLRLRNRSTLFIGINIVKLVLQLTLNIVFVVVLDMGVRGILIGTLATNVVVGGWLAGRLVKEVGLRFNRSATRDLVRFGLPMVATQVATFFIVYADRYFLRAAADTSVVGVYSLAYQFGFLLLMLGSVPFLTVWGPTRFAIAQRADRDALYARAFVYFNIVLFTVAVGIVLFTYDLLRVMSNPEFLPAASIVPVVLVAFILQGWTKFQNLGILYREQTIYITLANWVAAGVALAGYVVLIPRYFAIGAALATVAAFAVRQVIVYAVSQRLWKINYNWPPVVRLSAVAVAVSLGGWALPAADVIPSLAMRLGLFGGFGLGVWFFDILSEADRAVVRSGLRSPRNILAFLRG